MSVEKLKGEEAIEFAVTGLNDSYVIAFVVNSELGMGTGKIASQVAHATLGIYRLLKKSNETSSLSILKQIKGEKKILFKGESTQHLLMLMKEALQKRLLSYMFCDDGFTQIAPGSKTVLSIFGLEESVNQVTAKLKSF